MGPHGQPRQNKLHPGNACCGRLQGDAAPDKTSRTAAEVFTAVGGGFHLVETPRDPTEGCRERGRFTVPGNARCGGSSLSIKPRGRPPGTPQQMSPWMASRGRHGDRPSRTRPKDGLGGRRFWKRLQTATARPRDCRVKCPPQANLGDITAEQGGKPPPSFCTKP